MHSPVFHDSAEDGIQNALLAVLAHPEGINGVAVARLIGRRTDSAKSKLRELNRRGDISRVCVCGNSYIWMMPELAKAFEAARAVTARERENAGRDRRRLQEEQRRKEANEQYADKPMIQRCIPANECRPLRPSGPRWVFDVPSYAPHG